MLGRDLGIDLGTANTLVYSKGRGIVLREPSVVAIDSESDTIVAVGKEAWEMIGRTPSRITAIRPLQEGVIADFETTRRMLSYLIKKASSQLPFGRPRVIISVPYGTTQVEKRAVMEAGRQGGAREVFLVEEPLAAAMGAGLAVEEAIGHMVVNIGGGTTEVAVIALGGVVRGTSLRSAGDALNRAIQAYLRKKYRLEVGERTAEIVKIEVGYACDPDPVGQTEVKGIYLPTGLPKAITATAQEIKEAMEEPLNNMVLAVKRIFEQTPPQLASDIIDYGITLTGGGALLHNLDRLLGRETRLPVKVAHDPLECVARGTGHILNYMGTASRVALYRA
ncbi:rod shape-determining protein MreB [Clostridiales bacterium PH28_bin88]|nr:rod shape-determining protein MreB [Clostridiales bacterium PH28_bin88]